LERADAFAEAPARKQIDFINGLYLFAEKEKMYLAAYEADLPVAQWPQVGEEIVIRDPLFGIRNRGSESGELSVEMGNGWVLSVEEIQKNDDSWRQEAGAWSAWLDADKIPAGELVIRPRQPGDVFAPLGMGGQTTKVQDYFINIKIPRRARLHWPLVCVGEQVLWVVGYRIAHPFRITEKTRHILHLEIKKLPQT
jgi:tRNA(Ile)-lysidine synthetase-like protein